MITIKTLLKSYCVFVGVVTNEGDASSGRSSWLDLVKAAWNDLSTRKSISDVDMQFVAVHRRTEFTMDMLIEGK